MQQQQQRTMCEGEKVTDDGGDFSLLKSKTSLDKLPFSSDVSPHRLTNFEIF